MSLRRVGIALLWLLWACAFYAATRWHNPDADMPHEDPWGTP